MLYILTCLEGVEISSLDHVEQIVYASSVGDVLEAEIYRDGIRFRLTILVGEEKH